jgi:hypothetical protein
MPHKAKFKQQHRREKKKSTGSRPPQSQAHDLRAQPSVSPIKASNTKTKPTAPAQSIAAIGATRYPYMIHEMKWIGIFSGIIAVILIVLSLVLPRFIS